MKEKIATLALAWNQIAALADEAPGSRFRLQLSDAGRPFIERLG
jgi:hypothetical protein